ncbi:MAG: hypothetical protein WCW40_06535 [Bacteroidota bacterium]
MQIPVFAHIAAASALLPLGAGLRYWKASRFPMKLFAAFSGFSVLHLLVEFVLGRMGKSNMWLVDFHQIVELFCILYVYHAWTTNRRLKDIFQYSAMFYSLTWIINKFYFEDPQHFSEINLSIAMLMLIIASVIILNSLVRITQHSVIRHSVFWIASGVLLYSAGTIIVIALSNQVLAMGIEYFNIMWHINWGFTIFANILYARSFACKIF